MAHDFQVSAVPGAPRVGHEDAVEGQVLQRPGFGRSTQVQVASLELTPTPITFLLLTIPLHLASETSQAYPNTHGGKPLVVCSESSTQSSQPHAEGG